MIKYINKEDIEMIKELVTYLVIILTLGEEYLYKLLNVISMHVTPYIDMIVINLN